MRLICPKCSAQYEIDDSLVPVGGREVECSGCGHVWFQPGRMAGADLAPAQLSRPLNESILSVLREEAERELNARKTEQDPPPSAETPAATTALPPVPQPQPQPQPQQVISSPVAPRQPQPKPPAPAAPPPEATGAPPHIRDNFSFDWQALRDAGPPARPATELPDVSALAATLVHEPARQDLPATEAESTGTPAPPPVAGKTYRQGLIAGVLAMALLAGLYSAAPALADKGAVGAKLMEWRELADQGHTWIYARFRGQD